MFIVFLKSLTQPFFLPAAQLDDFSKGFWYGVGVTIMVGIIVLLLGKFWKKVSAFFKPTRVPATNPGPSPVKKMTGCLMSALLLAALIVMTVFFLRTVFL